MCNLQRNRSPLAPYILWQAIQKHIDKNDTDTHGLPSCYYYNVILQGYYTAGFDIKILKKAVVESREE